MKNILSIVLLFISVLAFGQANPNIDLSLSPISIPVGSNATLTATAANFGNGVDIVGNSLRVTISVGANAEIIAVDPLSSSNWIILNAGTGAGNTYRLRNVGSVLDFQQDEIKLVVKGVSVGGPSNILGNITYLPGTNPLLSGAPNSSQGNAFTTDDNAVTSLTVIPSLVVTAVATIGANTVTAIPCKGGSATLTASSTGGANPMSYSLDGISYQSGTTFPITAGTYTVYGKDANNLVATTVISISEPAVSLSANASITTPIACNGGSAVVTVSGSGGTSPYASGTGTFSVVASGSAYSYTVVDANGCSATSSLMITQPSALSATASVVNASCNGGTGVVTISATGGTGAYTGTGAQAAQVAGTYTYTVTDANSCAATVSATIAEPTAIVVSASVVNASCNGGTGVVTINATGGTGAYTGTGAQAAQVAGTYTYTVTDANSCAATVSATIAEPTAIVATASVVNASCNGGTGVVTISAIGGTGAYTGTGAQAAQVAGTYTYTVTDANSCAATVSATIAEPTAIVASASVVNASCNGGTGVVTINAIGGTGVYTGTGAQAAQVAGTYTYTVTDANSCAATVSATIAEPTAIVVSASVVNASCNGGTGVVTISATGGTGAYTGTGAQAAQVAGTYTYTVTDANSCAATVSATIAEPTAIVVSASVVNASCNGGTGVVTINATGGTGSYTGTGAQAAQVAGTYTYTVTDANSCAATVSATIAEPTAIVAAASVVNASCNGGTGVVTISATGGTGAYTGTGAQAAQVAGTYTYTVTDANSCAATVSATIAEPTAIVAAASVVNASCNGGTGVVTISATGGTGAYTGTGAQAAQVAGTYTYTITDANSCAATVSATIAEPSALVVSASVVNASCNGGTGVVTISATGGTGAYTGTGAQAAQVAGTYTYTVTDANSCAATVSATIAEPTAIVVSASVVNASCNGGTGVVTINATGGTGAYTGTGAQAAQVAGTYTYTVTDANSCAATVSATIAEPTAIVATASVVNASCNGGTGVVTISAIGGTGAYTGTGAQAAQVAGTYTYTVTDANSCAATVSATINQPTAVAASALVSSPIVCNGGSAIVTVTAAGGTLPYASGTGTFSATAGSPSYTVTDANGCTNTITITVTQPAMVTLTVPSNIAPTCFGRNNGSFKVLATVGVAPFVYTVAPSVLQSTPGQFNNVVAGSYTVNVSDANGCTRSTIVVVTQPAAVNVVATSVISPNCNGGTDGQISVITVGGVGPFTYTSAPVRTQPVAGTFINLNSTIYVITSTDANGCTKAFVLPLAQPTKVKVASIAKVNPLCNGVANGSITATGSGGVGALTFNINAGSYGPGTFGSIGAGTYTVGVVDAKGCTGTSTTALTQPSALIYSAILTTPPTGINANGSIVVSVSGGVGVKTYANNASAYQTSGTFGTLPAGTYTVNAKDANNCTISTTVVLGSTAIVSGNGAPSSIMTEAVTRWFPNPTEGMSSMLLNSSVDGSVRVELLSAQGSRIRLIEIPVNRGENTLSIDLSELPRGIYTAKVMLEGKDVFVGKIERR